MGGGEVAASHGLQDKSRPCMLTPFARRICIHIIASIIKLGPGEGTVVWRHREEMASVDTAVSNFGSKIQEEGTCALNCVEWRPSLSAVCVCVRV